MPGVKGAGGAVPKRSDQRRRRNKQPEPDRAPAREVTVPEPGEKWHSIAVSWFESLKVSGQSVFYEQSDWATAYLLAESISRDLKPQVVGVNDETGEPVLATIPMKGASLAAYLKAMSVLLVTEGDRRRAGVELERGGAVEPDRSEVAELDDYRRRLAG